MRGRNITLAAIAFVALSGGAIWAVARRPRVNPTGPVTASVSAIDSTWCGSPLGAPIADGGDCGKLALTGSAPACLFWADCGHDHYELDCTSGKCRCEGGGKPPIIVPYDAKFCALDATRPSQSLHEILESAAGACAWRATGPAERR